MKIHKLTLLAAVILGITWGCQTDDIHPETNPKSEESLRVNQIVLGERVDNPYKLDNVKLAINKLNEGGRVADDLQPTHLYIRYLPKDTSELYSLWADTSLILFEYPLDYDFLVEGHWYHDPEIPDSSITWQYTVVPIDYTFQTMQYEVLYPLYMPEDVSSEGGRLSMPSNWKEIERESFKLSGLESELLDQNTEGGRVSAINSYTPKGQIRVEETFGQWQWVSGAWQWVITSNGTTTGLKGAEVKARFLTRTAKDYTDADGNFKMSKSFSSKVDYSIEFITEGYVVTDIFGWSTNHNRIGRTDNDWRMTLNYEAEYESWIRGTVMSGIFDFKLQSTLARTFHNTNNNDRIKVRAVFDKGTSNTVNLIRHYWGLGWLGNDVKVFSKSSDGNKWQTNNFYATVMHELAHTSHFKVNPYLFSVSYLGVITESYATLLEYYFTLPYYPNEVAGLPDQRLTTIISGRSDNWKYTPVFIDLIDSTNQFNALLPNEWALDNVQGYTLAQIEEVISWRSSLWGVQDHLVSVYHNPTETEINELFEFYRNIERANQ